PFSFRLSFLLPRRPSSPLFPYTTLFRSTLFVPWPSPAPHTPLAQLNSTPSFPLPPHLLLLPSSPSSTTTTQKIRRDAGNGPLARSEEHTSELQSRFDLVCRLLLEKKKHS